MYVKVRTMDGKREMLLTVSRTMEVEDFKRMIEEKMDVKVDLQRLFYRGKQLENDYTLHDYNININDVIQLMIKIQISGLEPTSSSSVTTIPSLNSEKEIVDDNGEKLLETLTESLYYKTGDVVDCLNQVYGAWFEAIISKIFKKDDKIIYNMQWEFDDKAPPFNVSESLIRPRARHLLQLDSLEVGQKVMINHNVDNPKEIGFWYDFTISNIIKNRKIQLIGILHIGLDQSINNLKVIPGDDIFAIEEPKFLKDRTEDEQYMVSKRRRVQANCDACFDNPNKKCRECGCRICAGKEDEHKLLLCDECDSAYHIGCLNPPLTSIPEEDYWYCSECKNDENEIVKAGDKLKKTKKKTYENSNRRKRNWDRGMACVGISKHCTIVSIYHVGPIPGVEVGTSWLYRIQVSEAGVHRPPIAGIHGKSTQCAFSIVLAGGYEDDIDNGDEFIYSGSGGRDLSGNKRTGRQTCDQTLTNMNKALALNCNAKFNPRVGATAEYWKDGIPVRVVRTHRLAKFSKYAPEQGNRYDGIYKVVKYYPEIGKSGFRVWKFLLRRDDPVPAPWTKAGKARIKALGLKFIYPDGYLEAKAKNEANENEINEISKKRKLHMKESVTSNEEKQQKKRQKFEGYKLESEIAEYIEQDRANVKLWDECRKALQDGKPAFLQYVLERFTCPCCLELVYKPVTTPCAHNICLNCLKRSFLTGRRCCLSCRYFFNENYKMIVNTFLSSALSLLYPGYKGGR
ncbi:hypothetical protein E2986_05770 [Frieseomelitta varia]|uniref:RING-type E3 ubiquitin transferase n=1 Tax=Frieseomelitta varia TaxID=561572 RepID=A0A833RVU9_9HYME|nr:E3 ubiquitin-protein ligase UHRF1-like [Frieseomelitta varia]KAF3422991.1 hypothetical protein E2986_05770 [Frieseomelitta varia]